MFELEPQLLLPLHAEPAANEVPLEHNLIDRLEKPWPKLGVYPHGRINDTTGNEINLMHFPAPPAFSADPA